MDSAPDQPLDIPRRSAPADLQRITPEAGELDDWRATLQHPAMTASLRLAKMVLRGVVIFGFSFIEIVAELLAPIVLIIGFGWSVLPGILAMAGPDPEARSFLTSLANTIPHEVRIGHTTLTPTGLIVDGVVLIAVVALCRTLQTIVVTEA